MDKDKQSSPATVTVRREWLEHVISTMQGDLPSGRIGDAVFLLRDQLQDILDQPATPTGGEEAARRARQIEHGRKRPEQNNADGYPTADARCSAGTGGESREQMLDRFKAAARAVSNGSGGDIRRFYECASDDDLRAALAAFRSPDAAATPREPFVWICLVPGKWEPDHIRAWTRDPDQAALWIERGVDMKPLYTDVAQPSLDEKAKQIFDAVYDANGSTLNCGGAVLSAIRAALTSTEGKCRGEG